MSPRPAVVLVEFEDLESVPDGVELCHDDHCKEPGLHAAHRRSHARGARTKTYICKTCNATTRIGLLCPCRKETRP